MHPRFQVIPTLITTLIHIYIYIKKKGRKRKKETVFLSMSLYFIIFLVNKFLNLNGIRNRVFSNHLVLKMSIELHIKE